MKALAHSKPRYFSISLEMLQKHHKHSQEVLFSCISGDETQQIAPPVSALDCQWIRSHT